MFVVIVGGGNVGRHLAERLVKDKQSVVVVEKNPQVASLVAQETGARVITGDGDDPKVLEEASTGAADVFVAVTGDDEDNLVACTLAKFQFGVGRVLTRVNNSKNQWMFERDMGVDVSVSEADVMARLLEEDITLDELVTLLKIREGNVSLVEKPIRESARAVGKYLGDIALPVNASLVAILREGRMILPKPDVVLQSRDRVIALTTVEDEPALVDALS